MIDDLDRSIQRLLVNEIPRVKEGEVEISFRQPNSKWSAELGGKPALNLFLYDVRENAPLRQHQWQAVENGHARADHKVLLKRTPLCMDCFYLVSAWSSADEDRKPYEEHLLLTECLLALARHPILSSSHENALEVGRQIASSSGAPATGFLMGRLANYEHEIRTRLAFHDVMTNPAEIWSALENQIRAGFSYVVTLALDPWEALLQEAGTVGTVTIRTAQGQSQPAMVENGQQTGQMDRSNQPGKRGAGDVSGSMHKIGGVVRDHAKQMSIVDGMKVVLIDQALYRKAKNIGLYRESFTDDNGRFRFQRLPPGDYVLVVGPDTDHPLASKELALAEEPETGHVELVIGESTKQPKHSKGRKAQR